MQRSKYIDEKEENIAQQVFAKYLPYWPVFILAVILGVAVSYIYLRYTIPVYEATATLIIKDEKKGNEESKLMESLDPISSKKIVENEVEVIQSRRLMTDVVEKLGLYAPITQVGEVKDISAYLTSPVRIISPHPDSIVGTGKDVKVILAYDSVKNEVVIDSKSRYPLNKVVKTPYGELIFEKNKNYRKPEKTPKQFYFTLTNPKNIAPGMLGALKAEPASKLSSIVNLYFRDEVPKRAEDILNQLIDSYRQFEINEKEALAKNTMHFVEERLGIVARDLDSIQKRIQQFKSGRGAVDIGMQGNLYLQNVSVNDQKLSEVNTQLSVLNQVEQFVKNRNNQQAIVPATLGVTDPMLSQLMERLYNTELEYFKLKKTVGENNPQLIALRDQINQIRPNIIQNIESQRKSLLAARSNIAATNSNYRSILQSVPEKERELLDISREEQIKANNYSFLLQKKEESEIAYASSVANNKVVDYALASPYPVSPKKMLITAIISMLFLGFAFLIIVIKENFTGKVLYRHELESRTSIPILGEIVFDKSKSPIVVEPGRRSFIAEEFRKLRISLSFLGIDQDHRKVLVTSSISGEGKSFIAANLAISLALTGKRVALVDMDLNNPSLAKILSQDKGVGVSEYLEGAVDELHIIKQIPEHENLFFISSGSLPDSPSELLSNGKVKGLVEYLDQHFDMVIIDTSPLVLVTDGYLLTGLCDATLYVIRHNYTPKILVKRIDQNSHINPIHNPAIIFNGVKSRGFFKHNYGYGYDYVYGNEYRNKEKNKKSLVKT